MSGTKSSNPFRPRAHRYALEPRQMYDGAALVEAAHHVDPADAAHDAGKFQSPAAEQPGHRAMAPAATAPAPSVPAPAQVYVVDQSVANWQSLVSQLPQGSQVVVLDGKSSGLSQIANALRDEHDIGAIHIISHGASDSISLGTDTVTAANIDAFKTQLGEIGASLSAKGDILLYGCDVSHNDTALVTQLGRLTQADVASSTDATGAAALGGDWVLESSVGHIETRSLALDYDGLLVAPTVTTSSKGITVSEPSSINAPGADRAQLSGWNIVDDAVGGDSITVTAKVHDQGRGTLASAGGGTTSDGGVTYTFTGTRAQANNWLNQLTFVAADVELGNTAAKTSIDVTVKDAEGLSATHSLDVTITPSNDPVSVADATKNVQEVDSSGNASVTIIGADTLNAIDTEVDLAHTQTPDQIVYSLTALPQYGYLTLNGQRLGAGSVFTQQDVIGGKLAYVHTATGAQQDAADGFTARVNDGATPLGQSDTVHITLNVVPVNQAPSIGGAGVVYEGQPHNAVDTGNVGQYIVANSGDDPQDTSLQITITALPTHGTLYFNGVVVTLGQTFDYAQRNLLTYSNDGVDGVDKDTFGVRVTDLGGGTGTPASTDGTVTLDVHAVDDDPALDPASTRDATVTSPGNGPAGAYSVLLTAGMIGATDVDSPDQNITFITRQAGLTHGYLLLNGQQLGDGATFTMADIRAGRVQYVQVTGDNTNGQDTFNFQVVDNTEALRWKADGSTFTRIGGDYTGGTPTDTLRNYNFTIHLAQTPDGNGGGFPVHNATTAHQDSTYAGVDPSGNAIGSVNEGGSIVLHGTTTNDNPTDFAHVPSLSYTAQGVDPSQVVYTFLGFTNDSGITTAAGTLQKFVGGTWVNVATYGSFTQADLDAGNIRFQHDGDSENFHVKANFSVTAGIVTIQNGQPTVDNWSPSFDIYINPTNDLPTVVGSSNTVINEGETAYITKGQLGLSDPDDAASQGYLEGSASLPGGGTNYAYNNGTGAEALKFIITSLPQGGKLQYFDGSNWQDVTAGMMLDASLITDSAGTTGLRFVSNGSEVRSATFTVEAQDRWGARSATDADVTIQITNVNDAPQIAKDPTQLDPGVPSDSPNNIGGAPANNPLTVAEGGYGQITSGMLQAYDPDSSDQQVQYTITSGPAHGRIAMSTDGGVTFHFLGTGSSFTQADVAAGRIYYVNDGTEATGVAYPGTPDDKFGFTVSDGDKEQAGNEFWVYTSPTNDAPKVTAPSGPIDLDSSNPQHNEVPGFSVSDPDLTTVGGGETDYMQVTIRLLNADGTAFHASDYTGDGVSIGFAAGSGVVVDADKNGSSDYLVLTGTRAQINAALAGLTVTFAGDQDAKYQVQVIADDRLRDGSGNLAGGANGGAVNQSPNAGTGSGAATSPVDATSYDWYNDAVPADSGNLAAAAVVVRASSVNEPGVISGPGTVPVAYEDQPTHIGGGFVVSDPESAAFDTPVTVTLTVPSGTLGIGGTGNQTSFGGVTIAGDNTGSLVLTGRASDIQALLNDATNGLTYLSDANVNHDMNGGKAGDVTLTMSFDDGGSRIGDDTGSGSVANNPAPVEIGIDIVAVNDAPTVGKGTGTVYLNGSTPVGGFSVGDVDYTDGGAITTGETDFMQVTVRVTDANGLALAHSAYADILLGSSNGASGVTVDGTFDGSGDALVIRGTRDQINQYLAGLQVSIGGSLANADQSYRVEVIADDRLRDLATGALIGTAANGGQNANASGGVSNVPTTAVDPYAAVPAGLGKDVASAYRVVFPSSVNNPTAIGVTGPNSANESGAGHYTLGNITLADPDAGTDNITATVTLPNGFLVNDVNGVNGAPGSTGSFGGASYTISGDGRSIVFTGSIDNVEAAINKVGVKLPAAAAGDNNAFWNGTFQVQVSVNDNGNHGSRPDQGTLDGDQAANEGSDATTIGDQYGYADGSSSALVTTRVFDVTINSGTQVHEAGLADSSGSQGVNGTESIALFNDLASVTIGNPADGAGHSITLSLAQLKDIANVPLVDRTIQTDHGTLVVTGYIQGSDDAHGTLVYHYELTGPVSQPGATGSSEAIAISTTDSVGFTDNGSITVDIVDDVPTTQADAGNVNENGAPATGNVVGNDHVGADATGTPVTGVAAGTGGGTVVGHVGSGVTGQHGTLTLSADGSYSYVVDNNDAVVNALKDGDTITDVYTYTITDADGDTSTNTLTITIHGHTDGDPTVSPVDGNGAAAGHVTVHESGLGDPDTSETNSGTIAITAADGLDSITVNGVAISLADLQALGSSPKTIDTPAGTLVLTGFTAGTSIGGIPTSGTLSYTYTLDRQQSQPGKTDSVEDIPLVVTDAGGGTATGTLQVDIVDDAPTANADIGHVNEDGAPATGNVVTGGATGNVADRVGADATVTPVSGVVAGDHTGTPVIGNLGTGVTGAHGTLTLHADGSYTYVVDDSDPAVNALKTGGTLTDTYTYTITDSDGDTSTTTLTITIHGHTDGAPTVAPADGNGGAAGHATVHESGLVDAGGAQTTTGTIAVTAGDGLKSVTVGGTTLTVAQLQALAGGSHVIVDTPDGTLELTGFTTTASVGGVPTAGTLSYTYTLDHAVAQPGNPDTVENIALTVTDVDDAATNGTLTVDIVNDAPTAHADTADVNEDGPAVGGNVLGGAGAGAGDVPDRIGADTNATPVTGVVSGNDTSGSVSGNVGTGVTGTYGTLVLNADGSYSYAVDNDDPAVNALKDGETLQDTYVYTITDGDGDTSTTTLTITIHGHSDGGPAIVAHDGNGAGNGPETTGHATVWEAGLTTDGPAGHDKSVSDTIDVTTPDGLVSIDIDGTTLSLTDLLALSPSATRTITRPDGSTLVLTGFAPTEFIGGVPTHGTLSYTYTLGGARDQAGLGNSTDTFALSVTDAGHTTATGDLVIDIVNDAPTARADGADADENGAPVGGNVITGLGTGDVADRLGADTATTVSGAAAGDIGGTVTGHLGTGIAGQYGTLVMAADGSYTYVVDDTNAAVNGLRDGQTITDVYTYTITDADGDTSTTTLTITIHGHTDGAPTVVPVDGNGGADGHATVHESGLVDHDGSQVTNGSIDVTADDGLSSITVGGTTLDLAQLTGLSSGSPVTIHTPDGTLVLTGFQPTTSIGGVPTAGTLTYTYTLDRAASQPGGTHSHDDIALTVTDAGGGKVDGTLVVDIVDDAPVAHADTGDVNEDGTALTGNVVVGGTGGDIADRVGADGTATPVTGVVAGDTGSPANGHVGSGVAGKFGTLTLNADGSYSYLVDNANPTVNALKNGETLTEVYTYTITDADGDSSTTTLTITLHGRTDGGPTVTPRDGNGGADGHATVHEGGLADHDGTQVTKGSIDVTADDGLVSVTVGGTTLTTAQLDALAKGSPVTIHTPDGTLVLTGFKPTATVGGVPTAGTLTYTYTLDHAVSQPAGKDSVDTIGLTVRDAGGGSSTGALVVDIANDVPVARDDSATIVQDGGQTSAGGNVFTGTDGAHDGSDRIGADGAAKAGPVTSVGSANTGQGGTIGAGSQGEFGTLILNADGTYSYKLDTGNPKVSALDASRTLTEVFVYTITDADGDVSEARLTITIHGTTPPMQARSGDQFFPVAYDFTVREIRQGYEPGLFVLPEVNQSQDETLRWQNQWVTGRMDFADIGEIAQGPADGQFVLNDGVGFSHKLLAEVHARSRVALNDFGLASSPLWDDFSPFSLKHVAEREQAGHEHGGERHERTHALHRGEAAPHEASAAAHKPVAVTLVPPPASTPAGAPSFTAQIAAMAKAGAVPLAIAPAATPSRH
ncbi:VCBS domain-containing protein [Luteibacter sp. NPDC031894]|uniref:VCBS domain-containing protein n=1 Tax=Luteibacter sp. NPDC031894 TaxID=3390572 RepID=UPI003D00623D